MKITQKQLDNLKLGRVKGIKRPNLQGRIISQEVRNKIRITSKGKHYSPATEWKKGFTPPGSVLFKKGKFPWNKGKIGPRGEKSALWKGGKILHQGKYWLIYSPEHPRADGKGYVREHRLVVEKYIGRVLEKWELVHHINGNTMDNNINNLELVSRGEHIKMHHEKILEARWKD